MKKYLLKILTFCIIILIVGIINTELHPSANYSNKYLNAKMDYVSNNPKDFNSFFIGSSKINNQIDCSKIDQKLIGVHSYNLGANGSFNLENIQTIERLLNVDDVEIEMIILELQDKIDLTTVNLFTDRSYNPFNFENYKFSMEYAWEDRQWKQLVFFSTAYVMNNLHYNKREAEYKKIPDFYKDRMDNYQGFIPLDIDTSENIQKRHLKLMKDTSEIEHRKEAFYSAKPEATSHVFIHKIKEIQKKCEKRNIKFFLLIPAPAEPDAKNLLAYKEVFNNILIETIDPNENPEFYELKNRWDYGHLNESGAELLSEKIAEKLIQSEKISH